LPLEPLETTIVYFEIEHTLKPPCFVEQYFHIEMSFALIGGYKNLY